MVVQSLVLSIINYCSKVWGVTTNQQIERVQKLENFAAKIAIGGARKFDHVTPILKELEWLKVNSKITYDICIFTYKICHNLLPRWLYSFPLVGDNSIRFTRQSNTLFVPRTRTDMGGKAMTVLGPKNWNSLSEIVKDSPSLHLFKKKLKKHILDIQ